MKDEALEMRKLVNLTRVEVTEDICVNNEEIIPKGTIGYIKYDNKIFFPEGVINLPEGIDPKYVVYDYEKDFWKDKIKIISK